MAQNFPQQGAKKAYIVTTTQIKVGKGTLFAIYADDSVAGVVDVYDHGSTTTNQVLKKTVGAAGVGPKEVSNFGPIGIEMELGIHVALSAATPVTVVYV